MKVHILGLISARTAAAWSGSTNPAGQSCHGVFGERASWHLRQSCRVARSQWRPAAVRTTLGANSLPMGARFG